MKRIIPFLLVFIAACNKQTEIRAMTYAETQCSDKWQRGANDDITKENIREFLSATGVQVSAVTISQPSSNPVACAGCTCPTSRTVTVWFESDQAANAILAGLGFK